MSGSKRHDYSAEDSLPLQQSAIRAEFAAQPPARRRETLDRVLSLLVDELRRRRAGLQCQHSALWQVMHCYGITEDDVQRAAR